jgi:hypothetical protein
LTQNFYKVFPIKPSIQRFYLIGQYTNQWALHAPSEKVQEKIGEKQLIFIADSTQSKTASDMKTSVLIQVLEKLRQSNKGVLHIVLQDFNFEMQHLLDDFIHDK